MKTNIESKFSGFINGVPIKNEAVYNALTETIKRIEEYFGEELEDREATALLMGSFYYEYVSGANLDDIIDEFSQNICLECDSIEDLCKKLFER